MSADVTTNSDGSSADRVSVEQRRRSAQRAWRYSGVLTALLLAILVFGTFAVAFKMHRTRRDTPIVKPEPHETPGLINQIKTAVSGTSSTSEKTASEVEIAKIDLELRRADFQMEFAQAKQALRHLESAKTEWTKLLDSTLSDSVGQRIAGKEELLLRFIALRGMPEPEQSPVDGTASLNALQLESENAVERGESIKRQVAEAAELKQRFFITYAFTQARINQLQAIRESAVAHPASGFDLSAAVSMRAANLSNEVNAAAEEAALEVETSLKKQLAQLKKEKDSGAALLAKLKSQLARVEKGESLDTKAEQEGVPPLASREQYEQELDQIRTKLVAFTTPGYVQPETADKLVYRKVKRPYSYSALQRIGALEDSEQGRLILLRVGGSKTATQQNDRPLGSFPRMNSIEQLKNGGEVAERVKVAQRLLRQYGSYMVEDGLLSP